MNDDPAATGAVAATSDDFRDITKSTGIALRIKLQEDPDPAIKDKGFNSYKTKPYQEDLLKVMTLFRENVRGTGPAHRRDFASYVSL